MEPYEYKDSAEFEADIVITQARIRSIRPAKSCEANAYAMLEILVKTLSHWMDDEQFEKWGWFLDEALNETISQEQARRNNLRDENVSKH
jgi:hypothetical protein